MKKFIITLLISGTCLNTLCGCRNNSESIGIQAVKDLYEFEEISDLNEGDKNLKELVNDDVYKQLTVTDAYRALNTYLKIKDNPCKVVVLDKLETKEGGYVKYSLDTISISSTRIFMFTYKLEKGKIIEVKEMECIPFSDNDSIDIYPSKFEGDDEE